MVIAVPVAALLLVAAGCGSSESNAGDSTATTERTDTTSSTDSTSSTGATDTDADASFAGCSNLLDLSVKFSQALGASADGGSLDLEATAKAYEELADDVPEEIRDAFKTVAAAFAAYAEALKDVDLSSGAAPDPDTLAKIAEAAKSLGDSELTAASAEIQAWAQENCDTG